MTRSFTAVHFVFRSKYRSYSRTCFDDKVTSCKKHGKELVVKRGKSYPKCIYCGAHEQHHIEECNNNQKRGSSHMDHRYFVRIDDD